MTDQERAYQEWKEADALASQVALELRHAESMGNTERIKECEAWYAQAAEEAQTAYQVLLASRTTDRTLTTQERQHPGQVDSGRYASIGSMGGFGRRTTDRTG